MSVSSDFPNAMGLSAVAKRMGVARDTVYGWIHAGIQTPSGRVRLESVRIGGRFRVTEEALTEFLRLLNPAAHVQLSDDEEAYLREAEEAAKWLGWK